METERVIGVGNYRKEDYEDIRRISMDKEAFFDTWEEWKIEQNKVKQNFINQGFNAIDVLVKPLELEIYCGQRGLEINAKSRAEYVKSIVDNTE